MPTVFRVFAYLRRYPGMATAQLACAIFGTLMVVVFPAVTREVIDVIVPQEQWHRLSQVCLLALGAYFLQNLFNSLRIRLNNTFEQKVIYDLRSDLYERLQRLPLRWFDNRPTGDIMTTVSEDIPAVERVLIDGVEQGLIAVLQIIVVLAFMMQADVSLALSALIPIPFLALGAVLYTKSARDRHRSVRKASSGLNSLLHDNVSGMRQIKAYAMEQEEHGRFNTTSSALRDATLHLMKVWSFYRPSMSFLKDLGTILVLWFGAQALMEGRIGKGDLVAFLILVRYFYEPIEQLHSLNQLIQGGRAAGERVFDILDAEEEHGIDDGQALTHVRGHIRYDNVGFSYTGKLPTVHGISIDAQPGQTIALVGPTGAGKSTLINLLTRFYEYDEGEVTIDGTPVKSISKSSLRKHIGYVTQESFLFNGSVRDNLIIGKRTATEDELWAALKSANAFDFVQRLPQQLDTHVGERGIKLSVGEKQRISIARALLRNPPVLLLDESHRQRGHRNRAPHSRSPGAPHAAAHQLRHRPPPQHRAQCRPHLRPGARTHHRTRHARRVDRCRWQVCRTVSQFVDREYIPRNCAAYR